MKKAIFHHDFILVNSLIIRLFIFLKVNRFSIQDEIILTYLSNKITLQIVNDVDETVFLRLLRKWPGITFYNVYCVVDPVKLNNFYLAAASGLGIASVTYCIITTQD